MMALKIAAHRNRILGEEQATHHCCKTPEDPSALGAALQPRCTSEDGCRSNERDPCPDNGGIDAGQNDPVKHGKHSDEARCQQADRTSVVTRGHPCRNAHPNGQSCNNTEKRDDESVGRARCGRNRGTGCC